MELVVKHKELKLDINKATKSDLVALEKNLKLVNKELTNEIKRQLLNKYAPYINKLEKIRSLEIAKKTQQFDSAVELIKLHDITGKINVEQLISKYKLNNSMSEQQRTKKVIASIEKETEIIGTLHKDLRDLYGDKLSLDALTVKQYNYEIILTDDQKIKLDKFLKKEGIEYV